MKQVNFKLTTSVTLALLFSRVVGQTPTTLGTGEPSLTLVTSTPTPTAPLDSPLPSQVALPPKQAWCPSEIFCAGAILQTVGVANLFPDDKTFVDKPTSKTSQEVLNDFKNISSGTTYGQITTFVDTDFTGEGLELEAVALPNFNPNPPFLNNVTLPLPKAFAQTVHGFWTQLIRQTNTSTLCGSSGKCESTLIPLNHTFVVPGGRFREQYYWDSFWIVEGLIESQLFDIANATLQNFMDELDVFGFIPNGGRIYYLNRSQPPFFIQMLSRYVEASGDKNILTRALPLAEKELKWWKDNRSVQVKSPFTNATHTLYHYSVTNTAPRPESYLTDYETANGPGVNLNETQREALYAELASGAETGWDYTMRWFSGPASGGLVTLDVRNTIAVDLNSILHKNFVDLANLYGSNSTLAKQHSSDAAALQAGILDVFWDSTKLAFYDFSLRTNGRKDTFSAAAFYPFWSGIVPPEVLSNQTSAFGVFSSLNLVLNRYNGTFPSSFVDTGLQWDAPNTWPPHQYIILQALRALPSNVTSTPLSQVQSSQSSFSLIPSGQLGLTEADLPLQPITAQVNASASGTAADFNKLNGTVVNGGNATDGEGWAQTLGRQLANRFFVSTLCSWHATGGSIPGLLSRLPPDQLAVTQSQNNTGNMFEKFSNLDVDSAGRGGEYTVQAGFGWTNGVLLWVASNYGGVLNSPVCPNLLETPAGAGTQPSSASRGQPGYLMGFSTILAASVLLSSIF